MSDIVIRTENLGKLYRIGQRGPRRDLRDVLTDAMSWPFRRLRPASPPPRLLASQPPNGDNTIWALKNVSFEVRRGEVVGIIGRNGSGKTTLLKILSRITEPTEGHAEIHGRVGSLLEVGTGFHPELTGRENIYLNGAILGMKKAEIDRKFDEIVAFAEVERFIDTPVKRYSSGMYVRLAFAVAAHLEPEILLVDEVLAVGDIAFRKKCLWKMEDIAKGGRTVIFVSHDMGAIRSLCQRAIWLYEGRTAKSGAVSEVVGAYETSEVEPSHSPIVERSQEDVINSNFYVTRIEMLDTKGENTTSFRYKDKLVMLVDLVGSPPTRSYNLEFRIHNELAQFVCVGSSAFHGILLDKHTKRVAIEIGPLVLTGGRYTISLSVVDSLVDTRYDKWEKCCDFDVIECRPFGFGHEMPTYREGSCVLEQSFRVVG